MAAAGTYGSFENQILNNVRSSGGGKLHYMFRRIVLPMEVVAHDFPFFFRHKALLPILPFYRLYKATRKERVTIGRELKILKRSARVGKK